MAGLMLPRSSWEERGWTVAEHTTSPAVKPHELSDVVLHYPGSTGPITTLDPRNYARGQQRAYVNSRGYSIGYSWCYWPDGTELELRGWDFRNAANAVPGDGGWTNRITLALQIIVGGQDRATAAQITSVRRRLRMIDERVGRPLGLTDHGVLEPTGCPGAGIREQRLAGLFTYQREDLTMPNLIAYAALPPEGAAGNPPWFVVVDGAARYMTNEDAAANLPAKRLNAEQYRGVHRAVMGYEVTL